MWDFQSGALKWRLDGSVVYSVALVPHVDVIVCGMADGSVAELSLETGEDLRRISRHHWPVMNLTVSSQGDRVASYSPAKRFALPIGLQAHRFGNIAQEERSALDQIQPPALDQL